MCGEEYNVGKREAISILKLFRRIQSGKRERKFRGRKSRFHLKFILEKILLIEFVDSGLYFVQDDNMLYIRCYR